MKRLFSSRTRRASSRFDKSFQPRFETLEGRIVMAANPVLPQATSPGLEAAMTVNTQHASGIVFDAQTHQLNIYGTNMADKAIVSTQMFNSPDINTPPMSMTMVTLGHYEEANGVTTFVTTHSQLLPQGVAKIVFYGYGGNDEFQNLTNVACTAYGGEGNDMLRGGGNDFLYGEGGNDALYCTGGTDKAYGGAGDDVLVSIGGGLATLTGGAGKDGFWTSPGDVVADASTWETDNGYLHLVAQFMGYSFDGGQSSTPISLELNGQNFVDPAKIDAEGSNPYLQNYADNPLFATAGPKNTDVDQGAVGDCYFVATLAAIADANAEYIQQMVVDLGDGTYAVRFYQDGQEVYVRVDADLWTEGGFLTYAGFGHEGSLWVAIVEKAYAYFRKQLGTYKSIAGGNTTLPGHLGLSRSTWTINDGVTPEEVVAWHNAGSPDGPLKDKINVGVINLLNWVKDKLAAGKALTTGARSGVSNSMNITVDDPNTEASEANYRRGQHVYMIDSVLLNGDGDPIGLRLYNPYGSYVNLTDFTRLYFCIGRATAWNVEPDTGLGLDPGGWQFEATTIPLPGDPVSRPGLNPLTPSLNLARNAAFGAYRPATSIAKSLASAVAGREDAGSRALTDAAFDGDWNAPIGGEMIW